MQNHYQTLTTGLRYALLLTLTALLMSLPVAAQQSASIDASQVERELEGLNGLLETTVEVVTRGEVKGNFMVFSSTSVQSYYLPRQGAVFVLTIPVAQTLSLKNDGVALAEWNLRKAYQLQSEIVAGGRAREQGGEETEPQLTVRERLKEAHQRQLEMQQEMEELRSRSLDELEKVRGYLVETVAEYGDRLSHVGEGEYVNLVLTTSASGLRVLGPHNQYSVLSGGKSVESRQIVSIPVTVIREYKAGRRDMAQVKAQVIVY
ncbi:MAG TPA: hypothetical protein VLU25_03450 [Acidobacteriota bacterium]|nr:hypothetical protein [Acidobacteriota bacterium]